MKLLVAIPVYDKKLPVDVVSCLLQEQLFAAVNGDEFRVMFLPSCSHPALGRNQLAHEFMKSDADRLFFLDSDVTFSPGSLLKLAHAKEDLVGGAYRFKSESEKYPVQWIPEKDLWENENGYLEVETLPGGFLSVSRNVFDKLKSANPDRIINISGHTMHCYFEMKYQNGHLCGEDSLFCQEWRSIGGKVWLDPRIELTHWDLNIPYQGNIGGWLKKKMTLNQQKLEEVNG